MRFYSANVSELLSRIDSAANSVSGGVPKGHVAILSEESVEDDSPDRIDSEASKCERRSAQRTRCLFARRAVRRFARQNGQRSRRRRSVRRTRCDSAQNAPAPFHLHPNPPRRIPSRHTPHGYLTHIPVHSKAKRTQISLFSKKYTSYPASTTPPFPTCAHATEHIVIIKLTNTTYSPAYTPLLLSISFLQPQGYIKT